MAEAREVRVCDGERPARRVSRKDLRKSSVLAVCVPDATRALQCAVEVVGRNGFPRRERRGRRGAEDGGVLVEIVRRVCVLRRVRRRSEAVDDAVVCVAVAVRADARGGFACHHAAASDVPPAQRNSCRASSASLSYVRCRNHCLVQRMELVCIITNY